jgi:hypothetical protein
MQRFPIPFVGAAYQSRSLNFSAQRCVNLFLEVGAAGAKDPQALFNAPGLTRLLQMPTGQAEIRGMQVFKGSLWVVSGNTLFSVTSALVATIIGKLATSAGPVSIAQNETQLGIVDGVLGYFYDFPSLTFGQITDAAFPTGAKRLSYIDGSFIAEDPQSEQFSWSDLGDIRVWPGLNFASAEGGPDNIVSHIADHRELYLFGETTTEIFVSDPQGFTRSGNTFIQTGCAAAFSPASIDNSIMWLGKDELGQGVIWQVRGGASPVRVSNHGIEYAIAQYSRIDDAIAYAYQQEGHLFYVITFPSGDATWVYDVASQSWHERAYLDSATGDLHRHRGNCHALFNGWHVIGDYQRSYIYYFDLSNPTDDGDAMMRLRATQCVNSAQKKQFFASMQVDGQTGVGTAIGQGQTPRMMLRYSDDGGHTWSNRRTASMGRIGQYAYRTRFSRLGAGRNRVFEVSVTDPVTVVILAAYADGTVGPM